MRARVGELREVGLVLVEPRHQRFGGDRDRDHLAPFFAGADRVDLHARRRLREQPHVVVDLFRVRQLARRAGDVAEHRLRRRHGLRRRQVVDERRQEERLGRVFLDLLRVFLVDRLVRIAPGPRVDEVLLRLRLPRTLRARLLGGDRSQEQCTDESRQKQAGRRDGGAEHREIVLQRPEGSFRLKPEATSSWRRAVHCVARSAISDRIVASASTRVSVN